jgi:hypothetical protein
MAHKAENMAEEVNIKIKDMTVWSLPQSILEVRNDKEKDRFAY